MSGVERLTAAMTKAGWYPPESTHARRVAESFAAADPGLAVAIEHGLACPVEQERDALAAQVTALREALDLIERCVRNSSEAPNVLDTIARVARNALSDTAAAGEAARQRIVTDNPFPKGTHLAYEYDRVREQEAGR